MKNTIHVGSLSMESISEVDMVVNRQNHRDNINEILETLGPNWKAGDIKVSVSTT